MLLPNSERTFAPREKLIGYLLSETHAVGKAKARFFAASGYTTENAELLEVDLLTIAQREVEEKVESPYGTKYTIRGTLETPRGPRVTVLTVWIIEPGDERPRFVTAYPA